MESVLELIKFVIMNNLIDLNQEDYQQCLENFYLLLGQNQA